MVKEKLPNIIFLMEIKLQYSQWQAIKTKIGFNNFFVVDSVGQSGGLALMWKNDMVVKVQNYSSRHIYAAVKISGLDYS